MDETDRYAQERREQQYEEMERIEMGHITYGLPSDLLAHDKETRPIPTDRGFHGHAAVPVTLRPEEIAALDYAWGQLCGQKGPAYSHGVALRSLLNRATEEE